MKNVKVELSREELMMIHSALFSDWLSTYDEGRLLSEQGRARFCNLQQKTEDAIAATGQPLEI